VDQVATTARLLPPERKMARVFRQMQTKRPTPTVLRLELDYGEAGLALMASGFLWGFIGIAFGLSVLVLLQLAAQTVAWWLLLPTWVFCAAGIARFRQAVIEGRRVVTQHHAHTD